MEKSARKPLHPDLALLPEIFRNYPGVQAVYLFGSVAASRTHRESDLDLAVVPRDSSVRERKLDMLADLAARGFDNAEIIRKRLRNLQSPISNL